MAIGVPRPEMGPRRTHPGVVRGAYLETTRCADGHRGVRVGPRLSAAVGEQDGHPTAETTPPSAEEDNDRDMGDVLVGNDSIETEATKCRGPLMTRVVDRVRPLRTPPDTHEGQG